MKIKIFDYEHESDLEAALNNFIRYKEVIDIKYATSHFQSLDVQIYSFSALVMYKDDFAT